jgi:hypothetical protein
MVSPSKKPSISPTVKETPTMKKIESDNCTASLDGSYGSMSDTASSPVTIDYKYELGINETLKSTLNSSTMDVVNDIEIAIINLLVKRLFSKCSPGLQQARNLRTVLSDSVLGISTSPQDLISEGK